MVKNDKIKNLDFIKFSICGVSKHIVKYNLDNTKPKLNYRIVNEEEKPNFIIMTNRLVKIQSDKENNYKTCFEKYKGESIISVERKDLKLSTVKKF